MQYRVEVPLELFKQPKQLYLYYRFGLNPVLFQDIRAVLSQVYLYVRQEQLPRVWRELTVTASISD